MSTELSTLEKAVLEKLCDGEHLLLAPLKKQLNCCKVSKREFTGTGFYTYLDVPSKDLQIGTKSFTFGDVVAEIKGLKHGAGFVLYIKDGILNMFEGFSFDETWPQKTETFVLKYQNQNRDFSSLPIV